MHFIIILLLIMGLVLSPSDAMVFAWTLALLFVFLLKAPIMIKQRIMPYVMLLMAIFLIITNKLSLLAMVSQTKPFALTILMIISVSLISTLVNAQGLAVLYVQLRNRFRFVSASNMMMYSSAVTSPLLNMATPMLYGAMYNNQTGYDNKSAALSVRQGMMLAMLIAPSFAPIAMVIGSHPGIPWRETILYSLPLLIITASYYAINHSKISETERSDEGEKVSSGLGWLILYVMLLLFLLMYTEIGVVLSIILSSMTTVIVFVLAAFMRKSHDLIRNVNTKSKYIIEKVHNEGLIFISSGLLLVTLTNVLQGVDGWSGVITNMDAVFVIPLIIIVLPMLSIFNIHPIIGFTLLQPIVYLNQNILETQKYIAWVCYWVVALQISPISVINITTTHAFNLTMRSVTNRRNWINVTILAILYSIIVVLYGEA